MKNPEQENHTATVELIAPNGLGFGEGGIAIDEQIERGILTSEAPARLQEVLLNDPNCFRAVESDDDGCGDGRPAGRIFQMAGEGDERSLKTYNTSLLRSKVFGGGLVVASSMLRAIEGPAGSGQTAMQERAFMIDALDTHDIHFGAHTDNHAEGEKCGCGAIDNYSVASSNAVKYRSEITATLGVLYGDELEENQEAIERVFAVYESLADNTEYFADATGKKSMEQILDAGAVVKELSGGHIEETIVLNTIEGTTLDQHYLTDTVMAACTEEKKPQTIQSFTVDVWRGKQLAKTVAEIAQAKDAAVDIDDAYKLAYADFLVRTLAVAATLTPGDLPVYSRR